MGLSINSELAEKIIEEIKAGNKITRVARKLETQTSTIQLLLAERGINYHRLQVELGRKYLLSGPRGTSLHPETEQKIIARIKEGITVPEVARDFNIPYNRVRRILINNCINYSELQLKYKQTTVDEEQAKKIVNAIKSGEKLSLVTRQYSRPANIVRKILAKHGVNYSEVLMELKHKKAGAGYSNEGNENGSPRAKKKENMLAYLRQKMRLLGHAPGKNEMLHDTHYSYQQYYRSFGSLKGALKLAGLLDFTEVKRKAHITAIKTIVRGLHEFDNELSKLSIEKNATEQAAFLLNKISGELQKLTSIINSWKCRIPDPAIMPDASPSAPPPAQMKNEANAPFTPSLAGDGNGMENK